MNSFAMINFNNLAARYFALLFVAIAFCSYVTVEANDSQFLDKVDPAAHAPSIESSDLGYDNHKDIFYYSDDLVERQYKRSIYSDTKVTLAGQQPGLNGRVPQAVNPFAVGQKSLSNMGSSSDRWDVKEDAHGNQYLALYHGYKGNYVVNKLRAHLLRRVANAVKDYLPSLDETATIVDSSEGHKYNEYVDSVYDSVREIIRATFADVNREIRDSMKANDDTGASATVVIVSKKYIVVASAGSGKVLAYDGTSSTTDLSPENPMLANNLFGCKKSQPSDTSVPFVRFFMRNGIDEYNEEYKVQFLLMETPQVAEFLDQQEAIKTVLSEIKLHKSTPEGEQEIYANSVTRLIQLATKKVNLFKRIANSDHTVMLVGLETDYKQIF